MSRPVRLPAMPARLAILVAVALLLAACGSASPTSAPSGAAPATPSSAAPATPPEQEPPTIGPTDTPTARPTPSAASPSARSSPSPSPDPLTVFARIADQTAEIRQLGWKTPVTPRLIDEAELRTLMQKDLAENTPPALIAQTEALYRHLGLMTGDRHLQDLYLDAMSSQVLGFYRDTDRTLYVVKRSGGIGPLEKYTVSHELTHALQDQHFGLSKLGLDATDQGDRSLAARSLAEGDASLASLQWMQGNLSFADLMLIAKAAADPAAQATLDALPPIERAGLTFPYEEGLAFVMGIQQRGGWKAVDALWKEPPASTEQVLHPEKYVARDMPVDVSLPADLPKRLGPGWRLAMQNTFGELGLRTWLAQANPPATADAAATGWGGDRVGLYQGPNGAWAVILRTAWDDGAAAGRFTPAAKKVAATLPHATVVTDAQGPVVVVASDDAILQTARKALGGG